MSESRVVFVRVNWEDTGLAYRIPGIRYFELTVAPEPGYPFGRKGLQLAGAWRQLSTAACSGMVLLDGDVAADPCDIAAMLDAVHGAPDVVHVAPVRIWPASTQRQSWAWGHWRDGQGPSQDWTDTPDRFSFGFTYLPRQVLARAVRAGLRSWTFPDVDTKMAAQAREAGVPVRIVPDCYPKHMHF